MFGVVVTINIKPGVKEQFMKHMLADAEGSVSKEPGCLRFDVLQDASNPNRIYLMEEYRSEAAFEEHTKQPHFVQWLEGTKNMLDGAIDIRKVTDVYPKKG